MLDKDSNVKIISIFDFDGSLYDTPLPTDLNREILEVFRGFNKPGWWGRPESLDIDLFEIKPIPWVLEKYNYHTSNGHYKVLMTGRVRKLEDQVMKIIDQDKLKFNEYHLSDSRKTIIFKEDRIRKLVEKFNPKEVFFYDDRTDHIPTFRKIGDELEDTLGVKFRLFHVTGFTGYELKYGKKLR